MRGTEKTQIPFLKKCVAAFRSLPRMQRYVLAFVAADILFLVWYLIYTAAFLEGEAHVPHFLLGAVFFQDHSDVFMDFFNVNVFVEDMNPYFVAGDPGGGSSYPPLVLLLAKVFRLIGGSAESALALRETPRGILSIVLYFTVLTICGALCLLKFAKKKGLPLPLAAALGLCVLLTAPMVYLIERANYLLFALLFVLVFFLYEKDESAFKRELSYLSLAAAVGFKLYPAVFALLLLKEKRFFAFLRVALYSVALTVLPFCFFEGGFGNIAYFLENLKKFSEGPYVFEYEGALCTNAFSYGLSAAMFVRVLFCLFGGFSYLALPAYAHAAATAFAVITGAALIAGIFLAKDRFSAVFLAAATTFLLPDPSYCYTASVLIVPLFFLFSEGEGGKFQIAAFVLLLFSFVIADFGYLLPRYSHGLQYGYTVLNFLQCLSCIALSWMCFVRGALSRVRKNCAYAKN